MHIHIFADGGVSLTAHEVFRPPYLAPDLITCHYFKDGWKDRKDELLRSIGRL